MKRPASSGEEAEHPQDRTITPPFRRHSNQVRFLSIIGSYGWGGKTVQTLAGMIPNLKVEVLDPVLCKGLPTETAFNALDDLATKIAQKHKENGFTG